MEVGAGGGEDLAGSFGDGAAVAIDVDVAGSGRESGCGDTVEGAEIAKDGLGEGMDVDAGAMAARGVVAFVNADSPTLPGKADGGGEASEPGTGNLGVACHGA